MGDRKLSTSQFYFQPEFNQKQFEEKVYLRMYSLRDTLLNMYKEPLHQPKIDLIEGELKELATLLSQTFNMSLKIKIE